MVVFAAFLVSFTVGGVAWGVGDGGDGRLLGAAAPRPVRVLGFFAIDLSAASNGAATRLHVYVPNVVGELRRLRGDRRIVRRRSDLSGRFEFVSVVPDVYQFCWKAPRFVTGCTNKFTVGNTDYFLKTVMLVATHPAGSTTFFGRVRLKDGSNPRTFEPMANVNAFASVVAIGARGGRVSEAVHVNNYGQYVLPAIPVAKATALRVSIEAARATIPIGSTSPPPARRLIDLTLPNSRPRIAGLVGDGGSDRHWTALPGSSVKVQARTRDADGDPVKVRWIVPNGRAVLNGGAPNRTVSFSLPNVNGTFPFEAVAYDGNGGYDTDVVYLSTTGVRFSGLVRATNAAKVQGARVEIGGRTTTTDAAGRFTLLVKELPRYVVNIGKSGYMPVSDIYGTGVVGGIWTLTRASTTSENPKAKIDVTNKRVPGDCPGALHDSKRKHACGPGMRVIIPANSLVDQHGNPPAGNVNIELATVDLRAPDQMPGDYSAVNRSGKTTRMDSWGAGYVRISDATGTFNLKAGATATAIIPIAPEQLASGGPLPDPIPILFYDDQLGVWTTQGSARRSGKTYVARVPHFSYINVDQTLPPGTAGCVRIDAVGMPPEFDLEVTTHDTSSGAPTVKSGYFDNSTTRFHLLGWVPANDANVQLRAFEHGSTTPIVLALPNPTNIFPPPTGTVLKVNSGGPVSDPFPDFPYTTCKGFSGPSPGPLPSAVLVPASLPPNVAGEFLSFAGAENLTTDPSAASVWEAQANQYNSVIDPLKLRETVAEFRTRNGFGSGEVVAVYANSGDLGFGREMHCQRQSVTGLSGFDVACYVTNYGNKDSDDFDDFVQALAGKNGDTSGAIATVGMEFSRIEDASDPSGNTFVDNTRVVKFYVWKGPPGSDVLAPSANLDGLGERPVPQLCQACHGGHFSGTSHDDGTPAWTPTTANLGSNFIAFDLRSLTTPTYNGTNYKSTQQVVFRQLNQDHVAKATSKAVLDVLAEMYAGGGTQDENSEVGGWSSTSGTPSPHDFYRDVVAPSCRGCHMSQDTTPAGGPSPTPTFNDWDQKSELQTFATSLVCQQQVMPHALITHRRFWLSAGPHQPGLFHDYMLTQGASTSDVANCH